MEHNRQTVEIPHSGNPEASPVSWVSALMDLISTRASLMEIESREAARKTGKKLALLIAAVIALSMTWLLFVAALVGIVSHFGKLEWFWVSAIFAVLHAFGAMLMLRNAKPSGNRPFPLTRAEFAKDRLWIESLSQIKKSSD